jgi:hypothetical protein
VKQGLERRTSGPLSARLHEERDGAREVPGLASVARMPDVSEKCQVTGERPRCSKHIRGSAGHNARVIAENVLPSRLFAEAECGARGPAVKKAQRVTWPFLAGAGSDSTPGGQVDRNQGGALGHAQIWAQI